MKVYPEIFQALLMTMTYKLTELLDRFGCEYVTSGGTLLGQMREQGFIQWDSDHDYDLFPSSRKKLFQLVDYVENHPRYGLKSFLYLPEMVKFVPIMSKIMYDKIGFERPGVPEPTIDVFFLEDRPGGGFKIVGDSWPNWYYLPGEAHPIVKRSFSGLMLCSPNEPTGILERYYGTWRVPRFDKWKANLHLQKVTKGKC